jgi:hypothetical protein
MSTPSRHDSEQAPDYDKRSKIALGVAVICGLFVLETVQAHRVAPQAASPFVWTLLGSVSVGALLYALWCKAKVRKRG